MVPQHPLEILPIRYNNSQALNISCYIDDGFKEGAVTTVTFIDLS